MHEHKVSRFQPYLEITEQMSLWNFYQKFDFKDIYALSLYLMITSNLISLHEAVMDPREGPFGTTPSPTDQTLISLGLRKNIYKG